MSKTLETDILIAGGGIAGLTAAASLAEAGFRVLCADPALPARDGAEDQEDLRSTAFLEPSIDLLKTAGLWDRLAPHATDLITMRLVDTGGARPEIRESVDFTAAEIGRRRFGCNLPNTVLRAELARAVRAMPDITLCAGVTVSGCLARTGGVIARLSDGTSVRARLAIAADGRNSFLRQEAGIDVRTWRYGQKALVFAVSHTEEHHNTSIELHRSGGPFTLVPLRARNGVPHSAVVWMETGPNAARLAALDADAFTHALNTRACNVLGPLALASTRALWPIISQQARSLSAPRLALIAEAAHVVPPIGAQGLNMSLADIACLTALLRAAREAGTDIGADSLLDRYQRARLPDITARRRGIDLLNRAALAENPALRDLRRAGLALLGRTASLKHHAMTTGLGLNRAMPGGR